MLYIRARLVIVVLPVYLYGIRSSVRKKKLTSSTCSEHRYIKKTNEFTVMTKKSNDIFIVQKHDASHLHYDFRLEIDGVLVSWAIPKGPPRRAGIKRLAVQTENHPMSYATFEGTIPDGDYGAGKVTIWDKGTYTNNTATSMQQQLKAGKLEFELHGTQLHGAYVLVQMQRHDDAQWLLIKKKKT